MIEISNPQSISKEAAGILVNALNNKNFDSFCNAAWNDYSSERQNLDVYDPVTNRLTFSGERIHASGGEGDGEPGLRYREHLAHCLDGVACQVSGELRLMAGAQPTRTSAVSAALLNRLVAETTLRVLRGAVTGRGFPPSRIFLLTAWPARNRQLL
jgi:hypothetical protein